MVLCLFSSENHKQSCTYTCIYSLTAEDPVILQSCKALPVVGGPTGSDVSVAVEDAGRPLIGIMADACWVFGSRTGGGLAILPKTVGKRSTP